MKLRFVTQVVAVALLYLSHSILAQITSAAPPQGAAAAVKPPTPIRTIDLTHVEPMLGLPASAVMGYPQRCSSGGDIFLEIYANSEHPSVVYFPKLYRVSDQREVTIIPRPTPSGYMQFTSRSFYSAKNALVSLIQASQPKTLETQKPETRKHFFLSITDGDGAQQNLVNLDLDFEPIKAAIFDSGQLLVLGADTLNFQPVLALLHPDGSLDRRLDLDSGTYDGSKELTRLYGGKENKPGNSKSLEHGRVMLRALNNAQFVPWGADILFVQPGSKLPIYRFRESGQQDAITPALPDGFLLESVLGSGERDSWVIRTQSASSLQKLAGGHVVENPKQHLFEVDPLTGTVTKQLNVIGPQAGEVSCAAGGKLSAIYYGAPEQPNVPDRLMFASALR